MSLNISCSDWVITKVCFILTFYTLVKKAQVVEANEITVRNIQAYMERVVTKFGTVENLDCPREFLGKKANLINEGTVSEDFSPRARNS